MPNKLKDPVRHKFTKKHYNKRDWTAYNKSLVNRGSITIWFTEDALKQWENQGVNRLCCTNQKMVKATATVLIRATQLIKCMTILHVICINTLCISYFITTLS